MSHAHATESGLAFDRIFMLADERGQFITARSYPFMVRFTPLLIPDGLIIVGPDKREIAVRYHEFGDTPAAVTVWNSKFAAFLAPKAVNQWLSSFFNQPVCLFWTGSPPRRRVENFSATPLGFADGYPYLLINAASLRDLQRRCPQRIYAEQFRPNLLVSGAAPWAEDHWSMLQIGDVIFQATRPCSRCVLTTVDPFDGQVHASNEPFATLRSFRTAMDDPRQVNFGINLVALNHGFIRSGDAVTVLRHAPRVHYGAATADSPVVPSITVSSSVTLTYQGRSWVGNTQQILLEQLEAQGISLPYSCRAGVCKLCAVTLVRGRVSPLKQGAVRPDGTILACSTIPLEDIDIA